MIPVLFGGAIGWVIGSKIGENIARTEAYSETANEINSEAAKIVNEANGCLKSSHANMTDALTTLGTTKTKIMAGNITATIEVMSKLHKNARINHDTVGVRELEEAGFRQNMVVEVEKISNHAAALTKIEEVDGATTLNLVSVGVYGFGIFVNPIFAIPALPALLLYSSSKSDEAEAEMYKAATRLEEAHYHEERCKSSCALFNAIARRGRQIDKLLVGLNRYFDDSVKNLNAVTRYQGFEYRAYPKDARVVVFYNWQIAQTVKAIIDTSMISEDGSLNAEIDSPLEVGYKTLRLLSGAS